MRIIPAIDLKGGIVVHAVAGRREAYRPLRSVLVADPRPATVARGMIDTFGLSEFYVADLDAIAGDKPDWASYDALIGAGRALWIDAGAGDCPSAKKLAQYADRTPAVTGLIVGLESLADARALRELSKIISPQRLIFSLDLLSGIPRSIAPPWQGRSPLEIAEDAVAAGVRRLIVLDVAAVGIGQGCPTLALCRELRRCFAEIELVSGGGVRSLADMEMMAAAGCDAALAATALHDGSIRQADVVHSSPAIARHDGGLEHHGLDRLREADSPLQTGCSPPGAGEGIPSVARSSWASKARTSLEPK